MLYDIRVDTDLEMDDLPEDPTKVFCELSLPDASYNIKQEGIIYKGQLFKTFGYSLLINIVLACFILWHRINKIGKTELS